MGGVCSTKQASADHPSRRETETVDVGLTKDSPLEVPLSPQAVDSIKTIPSPQIQREFLFRGPEIDELNSSGTRGRRLSVLDRKGSPADADAPAIQRADSNLFALHLDDHHVVSSLACLSVAGREPGYEKTNQDYLILHPSNPPISDGQPILIGVLDGHGAEGHHVSKLAGDRIRDVVAAEAHSADMGGILWDTFSAAHTGLANSTELDCTFSGATASVSVLNGSRLTTAWVGDSRAVLGRLEGDEVKAYDLTNDHKPDLPEEKARILQQGGRVEPLLDEYNQPIGPSRVWLSDAWMPGLAMSRSLGDTLAASCGVSCCPDVSVVDVTPADRLVIWASDGVWEFISSQQAVSAVEGCADAGAAVELLVSMAQEQWSYHECGVSDDISCAVLFFRGSPGRGEGGSGGDVGGDASGNGGAAAALGADATAAQAAVRVEEVAAPEAAVAVQEGVAAELDEGATLAVAGRL